MVSDDSPITLVFDAGGATLRITSVGDYQPDAFTMLGWQVDSIESTVDRLGSAGVSLLRYQELNDNDPRGIWTSPAGARVAWFHDPDGNVLSLTELPQSAA